MIHSHFTPNSVSRPTGCKYSVDDGRLTVTVNVLRTLPNTRAMTQDVTVPTRGRKPGQTEHKMPRGAPLMSMTSPRHEPNNATHTDRKLAIITQTYPCWRIRRMRGGMWSATCFTATPAQTAAGLCCDLLRPDLDALADAICEQDLIIQTVGRC